MDECFNYIRRVVPEMESIFITPAPSPLTPDFLAHMDGIDGSTLFVDATGGHTITAGGTAQVDTAQFKFGTGSALFSADGDILTVNGTTTDIFAFGTNDFTIDCWIKCTSAARSNQLIYDGRRGFGTTITLWVADTGTLRYSVNNVIKIESALNAIITDGSAWQHIAVARSGSDTKMFVDGTQVGSTYTALDNMENQTDHPTIGNNSDSTTQWFVGWIDEMRVINGTAAWTADFTPPTSPYDPP